MIIMSGGANPDILHGPTDEARADTVQAMVAVEATVVGATATVHIAVQDLGHTVAADIIESDLMQGKATENTSAVVTKTTSRLCQTVKNDYVSYVYDFQ